MVRSSEPPLPSPLHRDNPHGPQKGTMSDVEDKTAEQLATEINSPQNAQVDVAEDTSVSPADAPATREELILGKFKTQEDLIASYQELERNYTASRQARTTPRQQPTAAPANTVFDDETEAGISSIVEAKLEEKRAQEFARKHADELADPLLRGAVRIEIEEANARGDYMDQEEALANAKRALESRITPKVEAASKESFDEGKEVARRKEQAGAIGGVNSKSPEIDPSELNADEFAAYYGLK